MLGVLDGGGFGWNEAENELDQEEPQDQGRIQELTEKYGFDAALGLAAGAAGPEVAAGAAAAYGGMTAGEYAAEKAENPDYTPVKDKAGDVYDGVTDKLGDFQDEYGDISLGLLDGDRGAVKA
ncbi:MAG: hypothetical protein ABEK04_02875 [Candidatus Nanohalobium sp.]